jgi:hypothetical protein
LFASTQLVIEREGEQRRPVKPFAIDSAEREFLHPLSQRTLPVSLPSEIRIDGRF